MLERLFWLTHKIPWVRKRFKLVEDDQVEDDHECNWAVAHTMQTQNSTGQLVLTLTFYCPTCLKVEPKHITFKNNQP